MQNCIPTKFLDRLCRLISSLNDTKIMDETPPISEASRAPSLTALISTFTHELEVEVEPEKLALLGRHSFVNVDGDLISYVSDGREDAVGLWVSDIALTPELSYFEVDIVDCGLDGNMQIGVSSWAHPFGTHVGCAANSVGLSTETGTLYTDGVDQSLAFAPSISEFDRIGCGIHFDWVPDFDEMDDRVKVPVYFVKNGKKLGLLWMTLPPDGLHPAISMQSFGEEVRVHLGLNESPVLEDDQMIVDSNEEDWSRLHDIQLKGQFLQYSGRGGMTDIGTAQAKRPLNTTVHYFEIEIIDPGECCNIAVGLTKKNYPIRRYPGWNRGSIAYHADDGKVFTGSERGDPFGPRCHRGDKMGCGIFFPPDFNCESESDNDAGPTSDLELIDLTTDTSESENEEWLNNKKKTECDSKVEVFFTRNGKIIGMKEAYIPRGGFYPSIAMMGLNEKVRVDLRPLTG